MKPLLQAIAHAAFSLLGLVLTLGALRALAQMAGGPVDEAGLMRASGLLTMVSPCSTGRSAHFTYRVQATPETVEATGPCPNPLRQQMAPYIGQTAHIKYRVEHSIALVPRITVYEFRVGSTVFWNVQQTSNRERSLLWLTAPITAMSALAGMALVWLGMKGLLKLRRPTT